jgi:REP element-mobilizing transposase RayT
LSRYDYSQPGEYFVTICTKDRENRFGEIVDGDMRVNDFGGIVRTCWNDLPNHYRNVELDAFVVMPNHVHGIIVLTDQFVGATSGRTPNVKTVGATHASTDHGGTIVGDGLRPSPTKPSPTGPSPTKKHPLSEIVRAFKSFSARRINEISKTPGVPIWQRGYYDHIIRDERSLGRIREYIETNPRRWKSDKNNPSSTSKDEFDLWVFSADGDHTHQGAV